MKENGKKKPLILKEYGKTVYKNLWGITVFCNLIKDNTPHKEGAEIITTKIESLNAKFGIHQTLPVIQNNNIEELAGYAEKEANPLYPVPILWDKGKLKELHLRI